MKLNPPLMISSRLLPAIRMADLTISIEIVGKELYGRTIYRCYFDFDDGSEFVEEGLKSGCQGGDEREGLESLLTFLYAAGESLAYQHRTGQEGEHVGLFAQHIVEWAYTNLSEIEMMTMELSPELYE